MVYIKEIEDKMNIFRKRFKDNKEIIEQMNDEWDNIYSDLCDFEAVLNDYLVEDE